MITLVNWQQDEPIGYGGGRQLSMDGTSRVTGDSHARICERLGVQIPGATRRRSVMEDTGKFEARYLAFLETISPLRPRLHRYCARMTGSITDGEDVVQDALFRAYRGLETWDDRRPLAPWLFRIAHNQCIDFLRRRGVRLEAETVA